MTCDASVEGAERASRGRAMIMAIASIVLLVSAAGLATALAVYAWLEW
jgi:hypothetical protein